MVIEFFADETERVWQRPDTKIADDMGAVIDGMEISGMKP